MEVGKTPSRIHPLVAVAAVSVTLVSLTGVAAITGLLPDSHSNNAPAANLASTPPVSTTAASTTEMKGVANLAPAEKAEPLPAPPKTASAKQPAAIQSTRPRAQSGAQYNAPVAQAPKVCRSCGRIVSVHAVQHQAKPSGVGVVAGAVLGGVLGNQVGNGNGRTLATVAGAVGGGYAGNEIEKRSRSTTTYQAKIRMEDGSVRTVPLATQEGWQVGDRVKVVNGKLMAHA
ncbi:MAG: glycine zipper 2TM domain-containing protein [Burkholderiales bacterium]|nr:glycine zipper 2TM domain-containing protein [Burkholderiales bacterium]